MYALSNILLLELLLLFGTAASTCSIEQACKHIRPPKVEGATIQAISSTTYRNRTVAATPPTLLQDVHGLNVCEVNVTLTHIGEEDHVQIQTWLPLNTWNDRFLGIGGAAWAAGFGTPDLAIPASQGYAVSSTDAGLPFNPTSPGAWALRPDGAVDTGLLTNFAYRSVHDLAIVGKQVAEAFYGHSVKNSFFNGCSTGGRQALTAAQRYPEDFDGILAGSPAIYWTEYIIAELWPQVVMEEKGYFLSACELDFFQQAPISACDKLDGVNDGVINDPGSCHVDARSLVDHTFDCDGNQVTISPQAAAVVHEIWTGPSTPGSRLWFGLLRGASLAALAGSTEINGTSTGAPFPVANDWARYFVKQDPGFNVSGLDQASFFDLFFESKSKYNDLIGSANVDLSRFHGAGGKLIIAHGLADDLIYPQGSIKYLQEVQSTMETSTPEFLRLFLSPGVDHCATAQSYGAIPTDPFSALVHWVEDGQVPNELTAKTSPTNPQQFTRKICAYPRIGKYDGYGDPADASSYVCAETPQEFQGSLAGTTRATRKDA